MMGPFVIPLAVFMGALAWALAETMRGLDPVPRRAGITWAITCPAAGLLAGAGLGPPAVLFAVVSVLALGSLAAWYATGDYGDADDDPETSIDPDPGRDGDGDPAHDRPFDPFDAPIDWDAFDRARAAWESQRPTKVPAGV